MRTPSGDGRDHLSRTGEPLQALATQTRSSFALHRSSDVSLRDPGERLVTGIRVVDQASGVLGHGCLEDVADQPGVAEPPIAWAPVEVLVQHGDRCIVEAVARGFGRVMRDADQLLVAEVGEVDRPGKRERSPGLLSTKVVISSG